MVNTYHPLVTHTSANPPAIDVLRCRAAIHRSHRFSQRPQPLLLARPRARTSKDTRLVARPTRASRLLGRHAVLRDGRVLPLLFRTSPSQHPRCGTARAARTALACTRSRAYRLSWRRARSFHARPRRRSGRSAHGARSRGIATAAVRGRRVGRQLGVQVTHFWRQDWQPRLHHRAGSERDRRVASTAATARGRATCKGEQHHARIGSCTLAQIVGIAVLF